MNWGLFGKAEMEWERSENGNIRGEAFTEESFLSRALKHGTREVRSKI